MQKFLICARCGNLVGVIRDSGAPILCCGQPMEALVAGAVDASREKHVPVVSVQGDKLHVQVGSEPHPMTPEHLIEWIFVETKQGGQRKRLVPAMAPEATFCLAGDAAVAVYAYCNLHGLWKTDL